MKLYFVIYALYQLSITSTKGFSISMADKDLYIVGCGNLGRRIGSKWKATYPEACVYGETRTNLKHRVLINEGIIPVLKSNRRKQRYPNVVFCASPSGNENYPQEVYNAGNDLFDATSTGTFVFTSSGGIYSEKSGGIVRETSEIALNPRNTKLYEAEGSCLETGGCVIRLAGLYSLSRGAHSFWLSKGTVQGNENGQINLLSYSDAAGAVVALLERGGRAMTLLASDGLKPPMTRKEICASAIQHPLYSSYRMPAFISSNESDLGKVYDCSATMRLLNWEPKYKSFDHFIRNEMEK